MRKSFNILDSSLDIHQNYLLEASAGTGKTFSIQNLVVRLLAESTERINRLSLDEILIVTFTRAATRELKIRIRSNLNEAIDILEKNDIKRAPDYLRNYLAQGDEITSSIKRRLQEALFLFDQAQIFTIHSFCSRMMQQFILESNTTSQPMVGESTPFPRSELIGVIRDFFRTEIRHHHFSPSQMAIYLKHDPNQLKLIKCIQSNYECFSGKTFGEASAQFRKVMRSLNLKSEHLIADFQSQAPYYSNFNKETKEEILEKICRFARLFDKNEWCDEDFDSLIDDGFIWTKALDPHLRKKNYRSDIQLHYPSLTEQFKMILEPLIDNAGNFSHILASLAHGCRMHFNRYQQEEEKFSPDDLLLKMKEAIQQKEFRIRVKNRYRAVIVDEFQDTDPLQWEIFSSLFLPPDHTWKGNIYLVGDPKQSIYSFRQADIYTYLAAAKKIGENNTLSLDVNYRSQPQLVNALNILFSQENLPSFIPLPKYASDLPYRTVFSQYQMEQHDPLRGAVHFMIASCEQLLKPTLQKLEEDVYFPFIAEEVLRLNRERNDSFHDFAVLVRDRHQASRLMKFLKTVNIPFSNQRGASLAQSPAIPAIIHLMDAVTHPRNRGKVCAVFGTPLFGWNEKDLKDPEKLDFIYFTIQKLRTTINDKGFSPFFQELLLTSCHPDGPSVIEHLLKRNNGKEFLRDLQQLADSISDSQYVEWNHIDGIIPFLDQIQTWEENDEERVKQYEELSQKGIQILTLHMSKGLEFKVVFALGLINRDQMKEDLIPVESNGTIYLKALQENDPEYLKYCEERDSEKMRQLYVALTRAKRQLYVPIALHFPSEKLKYGESSPIDLLLGRLYQPSASYQDVYERIKQGHSKLIEFIEEVGKNHSMTYSLHSNIELKNKFTEEKLSSLQPPPMVTIPGKPIWITSFTTLSHQSHDVSPIPLWKYPSDFQTPLKTIHTLPASAETGVMLHRILEKITFSDFSFMNHPREAIPLIRPYLQTTPFMDWEEPIAQAIFDTLKIPLLKNDSIFSLSSLKEGSFYREMPFLFPYEAGKQIENVEIKEGLIKGVIDFLFFHEGRYYIVDWKTNWLGQNEECYEKEWMRNSMSENHYFLQASIYTQALKLFLKLVDARPFSECFGGIYYLFLRGIKIGRSTGIFDDFSVCKINGDLLD